MNQQKSNMFEHIIYEFYIYLSSYEYLSSPYFDNKNIAFDCHIIHLRNLSYFFGNKKKKNYWHVSEVLQSTHSVPLVRGNMAQEINKYASRTTGHLCNDRLAEDFKDQASIIYCKAFPIMRAAIKSFLLMADSQVLPALSSDWKDPNIQNQVSRIFDLLASIDNGCVQILGQSSMMSAPTTSQMCRPAFAPVISLSSLTGSFGQNSLPSYDY